MEKSTPARQETRPSAITDEEKQLTVARTRPQLAQVGEDGDDGLKVVLKKIFAMVGLRAHHIPAGPEKVFLHRQILKFYGTHTAAEVELAFEMAITGQLSLQPDDVRIYDQFPFEYFARVMNAYRSWAAAYVRQQATKETPPEPPPPTPAQMLAINVDYMCARAWMHQYALKLPLSKIPR